MYVKEQRSRERRLMEAGSGDVNRKPTNRRFCFALSDWSRVNRERVRVAECEWARRRWTACGADVHALCLLIWPAKWILTQIGDMKSPLHRRLTFRPTIEEVTPVDRSAGVCWRRSRAETSWGCIKWLIVTTTGRTPAWAQDAHGHIAAQSGEPKREWAEMSQRDTLVHLFAGGWDSFTLQEESWTTTNNS